MTRTVDTTSRRALRRHFRQLRREMTPAARQHAAVALAERLIAQPCMRRARRIAMYLPQDGEMDPLPLARWLWRRGQQVLLPVITPVRGNSPQLRFAPWLSGARLLDNRLGIAEPMTPRVAAWVPDLVLLPLVAFDAQGQRLGMGGGFYDRTFATNRGAPRRPLLIGVAHACQQAPRLPTADHDVPLDAIATDSAWLPCSSRILRNGAPARATNHP